MDPTDEELVAAVLSGDLGAFDRLMSRYERLVYRVVQRAGQGREDALDATQTVFLKAYRSLRSFRREASFKTWLLRIAHREGLNLARGRRRIPEREAIDEAAPELARPAAQETELVAAERAGLLRRALATLQGRPRTAIQLHYLDHWSIRDVAHVLEASEGTTKSILFRGVRSLRRAVEELSA
jgi:RNA polymerase sigma-70 factor (ECF subfamily)